ncbi:MAG: serine/threonine protein kinase [Leptolyngbya sp. ERB_1_1]
MYCLNSVCPHPENLANTVRCQACGASLLLRDRYGVLHALGQGGFGATFLAKDESLPGQPHCVIKQLRPTATAPHVMQMARDLFEREAQTLGRIGNHPQVPRLLDYFEANEEFFLVQEYISGSTLQQEIKRSGAFSEAGVKQFLSEILPIMQYVHSHQVIHRDIKPANLIRRSQDCKLVLIDFGAVKNQVNPVSTSLSDQTALTAYAIGTPGFAPPEQMAMRPVYASDLYAIGVTCLYLLTGKSPKDLDYDPATGELIWQKQVHVSDHFAGVLKKMLEVSVRHRFQSANEILRALDLEPYLDSLANSMNSVTTRSTTPKPDSDSQPSSPAARAAMAIRARNTRSDSTNLQTGAARNQVMAARPVMSGRDSSGRTSGTIENKSKNAPKLDAVTLANLYTKGKRDFVSHDLSALAAPKINLAGAVFHQSNLKQINLQGANLFNTDFGRTNLNRANLRDTNLAQAYLSNADLQGADLRGADLTQAYLLNANLRGANLCGANLTGAKLTEEQLATAKTNWLTVRPNGKRGIL